MKLFACFIGACAALSASTFAQDPIISPRADYLNPIRVLLYVPGTELVFDYPDVCRILGQTPARISFETKDGNVVTHQGAYTIIQTYNTVAWTPHGSRASSSRGPRFYDAK